MSAAALALSPRPQAAAPSGGDRPVSAAAHGALILEPGIPVSRTPDAARSRPGHHSGQCQVGQKAGGTPSPGPEPPRRWQYR